jgi:hypothetical protein
MHNEESTLSTNGTETVDDDDDEHKKFSAIYGREWNTFDFVGKCKRTIARKGS